MEKVSTKETTATAVSTTVASLIASISDVEGRLRLMHSSQAEEKARNTMLGRDLERLDVDIAFLTKIKLDSMRSLQEYIDRLERGQQEFHAAKRVQHAQKNDFGMLLVIKKGTRDALVRKTDVMLGDCSTVDAAPEELRNRIFGGVDNAEIDALHGQVKAVKANLTNTLNEYQAVTHAAKASDNSACQASREELESILVECGGIKSIGVAEAKSHESFLMGHINVGGLDSLDEAHRVAESWKSQSKLFAYEENCILQNLSMTQASNVCPSCRSSVPHF